MKNQSNCRETPIPTLRSGRLLAVALAAGLCLITASGELCAAAEPQAGSSCVACHTDATKLQEEAKGIPLPAASALQAGKG